MFGGVRIASRTVAAPPSARSAAISAPELPAPTTSTSRPAKGRAFRYSDACTTSPPNPSWPGQLGRTGELLYPVAITICRAESVPSSKVAVHSRPSWSTRRTSVANLGAIRWRRA